MRKFLFSTLNSNFFEFNQFFVKIIVLRLSEVPVSDIQILDSSSEEEPVKKQVVALKAKNAKKAAPKKKESSSEDSSSEEEAPAPAKSKILTYILVPFDKIKIQIIISVISAEN